MHDVRRGHAAYLCAGLLLLVPLLACTCGDARARVESSAWAGHASAFKRGFKLPSSKDSYDWEKGRKPRREALEALALVPDGRAVAVLLEAHKKHARFIKSVRAKHDKRRSKWLRELPARDPLILKRLAEGRALGADEKTWLRWERWILQDWIHVVEERAIAKEIRVAIASVLNRLDGEERTRAMHLVARVVGTGDKGGQVEFLRMLGLVKAPEATALLRELSAAPRALVRRHALEALGQQNAAESIDFLLAKLANAEWGIRASALHGLSHYRVERVIGALLERAAGAEGAIQRHYFIALASITGESLPAVPETWSQFWAKKANREAVFARWGEDRGPGRVGCVVTPPTVPSVEASTSFYGIKTASKRIVFVVDLSGSMSAPGSDDFAQTRLDVARAELRRALGSLTAATANDPDGGSFNIITYASAVRAFRPGKMVPATKQNKSKALAWLEARESGGLTNIHDALAAAFEISGPRKVGSRIVEGADTVFLMTDGGPTRGLVIHPDRILAAIRLLNRGRRVTIHTVGVGAEGSKEFLQTLARENYGEYIGRGK